MVFFVSLSSQINRLNLSPMAKHFFKYHGAGNDFILIDNREDEFHFTDQSTVQNLCAYHTGIGADGLILLNSHPVYPFEMKYFNADGAEGTLCGNGSRCAVLFAKHLGMVVDEVTFLASDGPHKAWINNSEITVDIRPVKFGRQLLGGMWIHTGSPHLVLMVDDLEQFNVDANGLVLRSHSELSPEGANVNFVEQLDEERFAVRTFERGVERETLSCGTGAVAVALAMHQTRRTEKSHLKIVMKGGRLKVKFAVTSNGFENIELTGPACFVFKGELS